jgi:hypothetical protein
MPNRIICAFLTRFFCGNALELVVVKEFMLGYFFSDDMGIEATGLHGDFA